VRAKSVKAVREEEVKLRVGVWFVKQVGFKPGVKERGSNGWAEWSGESEEEEWWVKEYIIKSEMKKLVPEWGWRRDKESRFQRHGEAYRKERSVILKEDDVGGYGSISL